MKINENTLLEGHIVVLVPYKSLSHIHLFPQFRYHEWMKHPELQHLSASETMTLKQGYDMQGSWREDDDKCTFIILDKQRWADPSIEEEQCMVGDVNMFLTEPTDLSLAELEIMIAVTRVYKTQILQLASPDPEEDSLQCPELFSPPWSSLFCPVQCSSRTTLSH
uniref:N-acetyltransferase domain-containing protein n=1 Tax=Monopterus albus TaxID=43700 RepID=A0A3Q3K6B3_MONAL